jgi:hypothetical protein
MNTNVLEAYLIDLKLSFSGFSGPTTYCNNGALGQARG